MSVCTKTRHIQFFLCLVGVIFFVCFYKSWAAFTCNHMNLLMSKKSCARSALLLASGCAQSIYWLCSRRGKVKKCIKIALNHPKAQQKNIIVPIRSLTKNWFSVQRSSATYKKYLTTLYYGMSIIVLAVFSLA